MNPRESFLTRVFARLEEADVPYCVERNFDTVFVDGASDVDLLALDVEAVRAACVEAASDTGFVLVQSARFANESWVFAHTSGVLVRIDVDTAVRWRWWHVLSAAEVLAARKRGERFYYAAPQHEAAILRAQIAWRGEVPARYAARLAELGQPVASLAQTRGTIALRALAHPLAMFAYAVSDAVRGFERCFGALVGTPARGGTSLVLAGLDGAGKTTFARALMAEAMRSRRFVGVRYFHWIPSPFRRPEFPWPAEREQARRAPAAPGFIPAVLSALRLARNGVLAWLGFALVVWPLMRRGWLVIIDRYVTNYWLDPASVRYAGPAWWLGKAEYLFPEAELLVVLSADAATLRARKKELSVEQITEQSTRLNALPALASSRLKLDAAQPTDTLVEQTLDILT